MKIFCSGIGGIGLSGYAAHQRVQGNDVRGSDRSDSELLEDLRSQGIGISLNQDGSAIPTDTELFVYSEAIPSSSPERMQAKKMGIRQLSYFQALGEMTKGKEVICICGTHGKSSTTAMVAKVLIDAGKDPNVVLGTKSLDLENRNWRASASIDSLWIIEACEYRRSFHFLSPTIILLTNADGDHFDAFSTIDEYREAFVEFIELLPKTGRVIYHGRDSVCKDIVTKAGKHMIDADTLALPKLSVPGMHMARNAQLVRGLAGHLGLDTDTTLTSLQNFSGTWRRMEVKGTTKEGAIVIDDYAHHPVEIRATLTAMKEAYPLRRIVAVFQPHTHHRTQALWKEFSTAFDGADILILTDVYDARKENGNTSTDLSALAQEIRKNGKTDVRVGGSLREVQDTLTTESILHENDLAVMMGAGSIASLAPSIVVRVN